MPTIAHPPAGGKDPSPSSTSAHRSRPVNLATPQTLRRLTQIGFAAFILVVGIQSEMAGENSATVLPEPEAFCPYGGLETLYHYVVSGGQTVRHTSLSNLVLAAAVLLTAVIARSAFCGWICPLGFLQDTVSGLSAFLQRRIAGLRQAVRLIKRRGAFLAAVDRPLRLLKYLVLAWSLWGAATYGFMLFRDYDPWAALLDIAHPTITFGMVVLVVTLVASLFVGRPWCRYACPLGAAGGLFGRLSPVYLERDKESCTSCTLCARSCPMGLPVDRETTIRHADCMGCLECTAACPRSGSLKLKLGLPLVGRKPAISLNPFVYGFVALTLFMGTIMVADANGYWQVSRKMPSGTNVQEIKASMMIGDIARAYGVSLEEIVSSFSLPPDTPPSVKVKDLQGQGLSPAALRSWLQERVDKK